MRTLLGELMRFALSGVLITTIYFVSVYVLVQVVGCELTLANLIAYPVAVACSYLLHSQFSFGVGMNASNLLRFCVVTILMFMLIVLTTELLQRTSVPYYSSTVIIPVMASALNFLLYKHWAFARRTQS